MSSPYSPTYRQHSSSPMHTQVVKKPIVDTSLDTFTAPCTDQSGIFTTPTPSPTPNSPLAIKQPLTPSTSSPSLVQSSRLPLRKRPAKDQRPTPPTQFQWQPVETARVNTDSYPRKSELHMPSEGASLGSINHSFTDFVQSPHYDHQHSKPNTTNTNTTSSSSSMDLSLLVHPSPPPTSIPSKPIQKLQQHQQHLPPSKKKPNSTDENDRPIKKVKRGRPPSSASSSSAVKPLSNQSALNKSNLAEPVPNTSDSTTTAPATTTTNKKPSGPPHSSTLYCFCQKPYDVSQFMIACDRCDQWFHGECIGIDEKQGEFIDLYFCVECAKLSSKQTSWKSKCSNPSCLKPARMGKNQQNHLSKYCSDDCGMQLARDRLASCDPPDEDPITFSSRMEQLSKTRLSLFADRDDRQRLSRLRNEKRRAIDIITKVNLKKQFLQAHLTSLEDQGGPDPCCGFDSRLLWEEDIWHFVTAIETQPQLRLVTSSTINDTPTQCHQKSKRCQRHNGWIKLKTAELDQEREEQFVVLSILARERKLIKARMENRMNEMNVARSLMNGTLLHFK